MDFVEQGRSLLLAQNMAGGVIHILVASTSIDRKQAVHQLDDAGRLHVLLVELDCVVSVRANFQLPTSMRARVLADAMQRQGRHFRQRSEPDELRTWQSFCRDGNRMSVATTGSRRRCPGVSFPMPVMAND